MYRKLLLFNLILINTAPLCAMEQAPDQKQPLVGKKRAREKLATKKLATQLEQTFFDIPDEQQAEYLEVGFPLYTWSTAQKHPLYNRTTTYLERAVFENNISLLRLYQSYGASLSDRNEYGHALLHQLLLSAFHPDAPLAVYPVVSIVKNLLDLGVQTHVGDANGTLAYYYAVVIEKDLFDHSIKVRMGHTKLSKEIQQLQAGLKPPRKPLIRKKNQLILLETIQSTNAQKRLELLALLPMLSPNNTANQVSAAISDTPSDKSSS